MDDAPRWPGDYRDGNPCCCLFMTVHDIKGYGFPSSGLPTYLHGFGLNGWRVELDEHGEPVLVPGGYAQFNEHGCRSYLKLHKAKIKRQILEWEEYNAWLDNPAPSAEATEQESSAETLNNSQSDACAVEQPVQQTTRPRSRKSTGTHEHKQPQIILPAAAKKRKTS